MRRGLSPLLYPEPYVFATAGELPSGPGMFAAIAEDEGLTLVLTKADADAAGLPYSFVAARITLRLETGLDEIGVTAAFSRVLADAGIGCNVIAGTAHDHLFVPWHQGAAAAELLRAL